MDRKIAYVILNMLQGIGPARIRKLLEAFDSPDEILNSDMEKLTGLLGPKTAQYLKNWKDIKWDEEIKKAEQMGIRIVTFEDSEYPSALRNISDPPPVLYIKGKIPQNQISIAIVGTRNPSFYGVSMAEKFASQLSLYGVCVISGMARGIDSIAHKAALKQKGSTIAVLGSGLAHIYPPENSKLAEEISQTGAVISEFPLDTIPEKFNFPRRNRIISGLSDAVIVIEAGPRSGALITAHLAADQGKDVFVLPSDANRITGKGNNQLIKEGATLVESVDEIINAMNLEIVESNTTTSKQFDGNLTEEEKLVYNVIMGKNLSFEQIQAQTGISTAKLTGILTGLEIKGLITSGPGYIYTDRNLNRQQRGEK